MENLIKLPTQNDSPIIKGDTWLGVSIEILEDNVAINLTGATTKIDLIPKSTKNSIIKLATGTGITITSPNGGIFQIDPINRLNWAVDTYLGDIEVTHSNGERITYCQISITISDDKTK